MFIISQHSYCYYLHNARGLAVKLETNTVRSVGNIIKNNIKEFENASASDVVTNKTDTKIKAWLSDALDAYDFRRDDVLHLTLPYETHELSFA